MSFDLDQGLREYATDRQWEVLQALSVNSTYRETAKILGVKKSTVTSAVAAVKRRAEQHGYAPEHGWQHPVPPGFHVKGMSTLRDMSSGEAIMQWEKSERTKEDHEKSIRAFASALSEDLPQITPRKSYPKCTNEEWMTVIPMGDPHFGMYAWADEAGEDFDLEIAKRDLCGAVNYLVGQSPESERCVIINLGDFYHVDNLKNMTSQSGNVLDVDTRLPKMIEVGVCALRQSIESALNKHKVVEIVNAIGNHDGVLAMALTVMMRHIYEKESRVIVHHQPTPRHYIEHGKVLIGVTHGDRTKDRDLPGIMATEKPEEWGRTRYRYFYRGHHHHDTLEMFNGCTVEQFSTLAANDAWHNAGGYLTGRNMKLIVHHKEYGEISRSVCSIDMVRGINRE